MKKIEKFKKFLEEINNDICNNVNINFAITGYNENSENCCPIIFQLELEDNDYIELVDGDLKPKGKLKEELNSRKEKHFSEDELNEIKYVG